MKGIAANSRDDAQPMPPGWRLWLWWTLAGAVGWGVGGPLGVALGQPGYIIENGFMSISFGGILIGVLQWLVLRHRLARAGRWVPAWIVAAVISGAVVFGGLKVDPNGTWITDVTWIFGAALFTPVAAFLQWRLVLTRYLAGGAGRWVLAGLVGFFAAGILGAWPVSAVFGFTGKQGGLEAVVTWFAFGTVYGALTGAVLVKLLRRPATATSVGLSAA